MNRKWGVLPVAAALFAVAESVALKIWTGWPFGADLAFAAFVIPTVIVWLVLGPLIRGRHWTLSVIVGGLSSIRHALHPLPTVRWTLDMYEETWWIVLVFGVATGLVIRRIMPIRCRQESPWPCCPQCGYNLTGNVSGRCPECGTCE